MKRSYFICHFKLNVKCLFILESLLFSVIYVERIWGGGEHLNCKSLVFLISVDVLW